MRMNLKERLDALTASQFDGNKYDMFVEGIMGLTTYDSGLNKEFAISIIEVINVIFERKTFEYIDDYHNYKKYILVAQILNQKGWLEWGTSIRGAWFDSSLTIGLITCAWVPTEMKIPYSIDNLKAVVKYMEENG